MSDTRTLIKDLITKPPVAFPLVALFHILIFIWSLTTLAQAPGTATELNSLWLLGYTIFWLGATALRKWGGIGYILVTAADIVTWYTLDAHHKNLYTSSLFLISIVFSFFVIVYYRRFR